MHPKQKLSTNFLIMLKKINSPSLPLMLFFTFSCMIYFSCNNNKTNDKASVTAKADSAKILFEKGKYLAYHVNLCMDCHSQRDFNQFSGPIKEGTEGMGGEMFTVKQNIPGIIYSRNITPDTVNGIGKWSDGEIERALTQGISKNGDTLFPLMPYAHYNMMDKEDIKSIIAFIRSLKPNNNKVPERKLFIPIAMSYPPIRNSSIEKNVKPDVSDIVKYGEYITNSASCMDCHTPMDKGKFMMPKYMSGGVTFDMGSFVVTTSNITPDSITGIGKWTEEMFLDKFKLFRSPDSYRLNPGKNNSIMPWSMYANMDDFDIKAIYRYLRSIPAVNNHVDKYPK